MRSFFTYLIVILLFLLILTGLTSIFYNRFFTNLYKLPIVPSHPVGRGLEAEGIMDEEGPAKQRMINAYAGLMGSRVLLLNKKGPAGPVHGFSLDADFG